MENGSPTPSGSLPVTREIVTRVFGDVKEYSKLVSQIPTDDYDYHQAFPAFRRQVEQQSATLVEMMDKCTQLLPKRRRVPLNSDSGAATRVLSEDQRTTVMEAIDSLLENVDTVLDDLRGRKMRSAEQLSVTFGSELTLGTPAVDTSAPGVVQVAHVLRPQLTFETPVDNSAAPFVPIYRDAAGQVHTGKAGVHPFAELISNFTFPSEQLLPKVDIPAVPLDSCPLVFVDTAEELQRVAGELMKETEIAVDLEHHDFYSFQGFTCLMQISSRTSDYIVDCLRLRSSMHLLAPVFLNPKILKVLHGAREDIRWLQKDFALYIVNFFDTGIALQTLHMPHSLAFAVDHFCQVKLNKKYQTADWRVRPMPSEMVHYARQDTHYLLYIYDRLRAMLLNSEGRASVGNLLVHVYNESRRLSLEQYEKPKLFPETSYKAALGRSLSGLNRAQEQVARDVFNWRDAAAREADDSPTAVLHLSSVLSIASKLPTTPRDLLRCCSPVSVILRRQVAALVDIVKAALGEAGNAAADASTDGASGGGVTDSAAALQSARPLGVYRPMTGALPSISSRVAPALSSSPAQSYALLNTEKSTWLQAMQLLSATLAARPVQNIPVPGNELLIRIHERAMRSKADAEKAAAAAQSAASEAPEEGDHRGTQGRKRSRSASPEEEGTAKVVTEGSVSDNAVPEPFAPAENKISLPAGAFSMRQELGTGAQDRKRAKQVAAKKGKKK